MAGYVRLYRSLIGHPAFRNDAEAMAFAWMIAKAAWRPTTVRYKGKAVRLERGELAVSQRDMAIALDRDKGWIERLWKRLARGAMVKATVESGVTVVSICNYNRFQADRDNDEAVNGTGQAVEKGQAQGTEQGREEKSEKEKQTARDARGECDLFDEEPPDGGNRQSESDLAEQYSAAFESWWVEYPNKIGKRRAWQTYDAAFKRLGGASEGSAKVHAKLLRSLQAQIAVWKRKGVVGKYIPHPATWLTQSRWEDGDVKAELDRVRGVARPQAPPTDDSDWLQPPTPPPPPERRETLADAKLIGWTPDDASER